jgi:hypothetical protein
MTKSFGAQFDAWAKQTEIEQTRVIHHAVRNLVAEATRPQADGGHMPVVRGNLRNSVQVSTTGPVEVDWSTKKFRDPSDAVNNAIAGIEPGVTAHVGFRAPYGVKVEFEAGAGFARLAAQRWPEFVNQAVRRK